MMTTYLILMLLFAVPVAAKIFADIFFQGGSEAAQIYSWMQHSIVDQSAGRGLQPAH